MKDTLEFLEEELLEMFGIPMKYPVDEPDREYVFFPAVSDYLLEPETLMGNLAAVMRGRRATRGRSAPATSTASTTASSTAITSSRGILGPNAGEVSRLRGRKILIGECGHASRSAKEFVPVAGERVRPVMNIMEYTLEKLPGGDEPPPRHHHRDGDLPRPLQHRPHGLDHPAAAAHPPVVLQGLRGDGAPTGRRTTAAAEGEARSRSTRSASSARRGPAKADQIRATGAKYVVAPCANCKKQLRELVEHYRINTKVVGLHDLVLEAIVIPGAKSPAERSAAKRGE